MQENNSQIIIYQTKNGETKLDVRFQDETVWLTQKLMAELFQTTSQNITIHLKNIFEEGELDEGATCKDFLQVQKEGNREVKSLAPARLYRVFRRKQVIVLSNNSGFNGWQNLQNNSCAIEGIVLFFYLSEGSAFIVVTQTEVGRQPIQHFPPDLSALQIPINRNNLSRIHFGRHLQRQTNSCSGNRSLLTNGS